MAVLILGSIDAHTSWGTPGGSAKGQAGHQSYDSEGYGKISVARIVESDGRFDLVQPDLRSARREHLHRDG